MREPFASDPLISRDSEGAAAPRVSIPDRRRIDSDVRAFLREPSTPWIVFDREGRPPSQVAIVETAPARLDSRIPEHGFFPAAHALPSVVVQEPSSLAVAAEIGAGPTSDVLEVPEADLVSYERSSSRVRKAIAVGFGVVSVLTIAAFAMRGDDGGGDGAAAPATRAVAAAVVVAAPPTVLAPPPTEAAPAVVPAATQASVAASGRGPGVTGATDPAKRLGRLSIGGDARARDVFLDGKRLLGHGARSFVVTCGAHTIAVGTRTTAQDVDVPCNAEYVVGK